jgi:hypothetical protein
MKHCSNCDLFDGRLLVQPPGKVEQFDGICHRYPNDIYKNNCDGCGEWRAKSVERVSNGLQQPHGVNPSGNSHPQSV